MIDLDAIKALADEIRATGPSMEVLLHDGFVVSQCIGCRAEEAIRDLIAEVERLRADATRAEADLTEDCTRLMRERDEARAEVERLRGSGEHEAMLAAYLDAAENAGWGTR